MNQISTIKHSVAIIRNKKVYTINMDAWVYIYNTHTKDFFFLREAVLIREKGRAKRETGDTKKTKNPQSIIFTKTT